MRYGLLLREQMLEHAARLAGEEGSWRQLTPAVLSRCEIAADVYSGNNNWSGAASLRPCRRWAGSRCSS